MSEHDGIPSPIPPRRSARSSIPPKTRDVNTRPLIPPRSSARIKDVATKPSLPLVRQVPILPVLPLARPLPPRQEKTDIDANRKAFLIRRRSITPNARKGIYPFKDIKLSGADVEWLVTMHDYEVELAKKKKVNFRKLGQPDLRGANLSFTNLQNLDLSSVLLEGANLRYAHIERAVLCFAHLEGADLYSTHLEWADLHNVHLEGTNLRRAHLEGAILCDAIFSSTTRLDNVVLSSKQWGAASLADVHWGDVNVAVLNWSSVSVLGDERTAQERDGRHGPKSKAKRLNEYRKAVRTYRQLAVMLQEQGLNEEAASFVYRAQRLKRTVLRLQEMSTIGQYLFSLFLDLIAGYGYKPKRSFLTYLFVISLFTVIYHLLSPQLAWNEAFVISMTAFHGRGFFPGTFSPGDPLAFASAIEAFVGLIIEVTFIATLTQRLFGK